MARGTERRAGPKLSHEAVREHLLDYHFGRLSPAMNAAVERHVRGCQICQREGLVHLATQKREAVRLTRKRPRSRERMRVLRLLTLVLVVTLLVLIVLSTQARGLRLPWASGSIPAGVLPAASPRATLAPTPVALASTKTLGEATTGAAVVAISPDGALIAVVGAHGQPASIAIWDAKTGAQVKSLPVPDGTAPGALAWSPDGAQLAGSDGASVMVWSVRDATRLWSLLLPAAPAMRVYDVPSVTVVQHPDPATVFGAAGSFQWSPSGQLEPADGSSASAGLWSAAGSHLFFSDGHATVGISASDAAAHRALLTWSPNGRFLLWSSASRPVIGTSATPAAGTPTQSTSAASSVAAPAGAAGSLAERIASAGHGDGIVWVSPDRAWAVVCDRTGSRSALTVTVAATGRVVAAGTDDCQSATAGSLTWRKDSSGFVFAPANGPVAQFAVPATRT